MSVFKNTKKTDIIKEKENSQIEKISSNYLLKLLRAITH
jgi:hypothetical protein